jgi:hypothetical protein
MISHQLSVLVLTHTTPSRFQPLKNKKKKSIEERCAWLFYNRFIETDSRACLRVQCMDLVMPYVANEAARFAPLDPTRSPG